MELKLFPLILKELGKFIHYFCALQSNITLDCKVIHYLGIKHITPDHKCLASSIGRIDER